MVGVAALYLALAVAGQSAPTPSPTLPSPPILSDGSAAKDAAVADESCSACSVKRDLALENRSGSDVRAIRLKSHANDGVIAKLIEIGRKRPKVDRQELLGGTPVPGGARRTLAVGTGFCTPSILVRTRVSIELADGRVIEKTLDCAAGLVITAEDVAAAKPPASPAPPPPRP